jgi:GntR family transcriptional regulator
VILTIDTNDRRPIYRQIADGIKTFIAAGKLPEGAALPPVRQLAADLGVNLNTIAVAYRELQTEGLILLKHGSRATVTLQTAVPRHTEEELRRPLRTALTELVLAGIPRRRILGLVNDELHGLLKGIKS